MLERQASLDLALLPHPDTPSGAIRRIAAGVKPIGPDGLRVCYSLEADLQQIRIPLHIPGAGRADGLWTHMCFEVFLACEGSPAYLELNFSPSGQWAAYRFESYRQGMLPAALAEAPQVSVRASERQLELEATVRMSRAGRLRLALSAVVEGREGGLSYWALRHPAGRPDFHHPESFSLTLDPPQCPL